MTLKDDVDVNTAVPTVVWTQISVVVVPLYNGASTATTMAAPPRPAIEPLFVDVYELAAIVVLATPTSVDATNKLFPLAVPKPILKVEVAGMIISSTNKTPMDSIKLFAGIVIPVFEFRAATVTG